MPRFNFAAQTAATAQAAAPTENATEPKAQVTNPTPAPAPAAPAQPTAAAEVATSAAATPAPAPTATSAPAPTEQPWDKAVRKLKEAIAAKTIIANRYKDADGHDMANFVAHPDHPAGLRDVSYQLKQLNAVWFIPKEGESGVSTATLPAAVIANSECAKSAYEARKAKLDEYAAKREAKEAAKAATPAAETAAAKTAAAKTAKANGERMFTEAQVKALLKKSNATLTDDLINLLIQTA